MDGLYIPEFDWKDVIIFATFELELLLFTSCPSWYICGGKIDVDVIGNVLDTNTILWTGLHIPTLDDAWPITVAGTCGVDVVGINVVLVPLKELITNWKFLPLFEFPKAL